MKKYIVGLVLGTLVLGAIIGSALLYNSSVSETKGPESFTKLSELEKNGAKDFQLNDFAGRPSNLFEFKGKIVVLNFWATWCSPCVQEFPSMMKMAKRFQKDLVLLTVSADQRKEDVLSFLKTFGVEGPNIRHLWDPDRRVPEAFGTDRLPETYVLDRDLRLIKKIPGTQDWESNGAQEFLKTAIERPIGR